jgi:hypothetical protein
LNQKMAQWLTRTTLAGGQMESGDRGLASRAKQTSIPRSGSFTEGCSVLSEGWTRLGKAWLADLRWQGLGWPRTRRARANAGEVERVRRGTVKVTGRFIGTGAGHGVGWPLARRGARGGVLCRAQSASNTWLFASARVLPSTERPKRMNLALEPVRDLFAAPRAT